MCWWALCSSLTWLAHSPGTLGRHSNLTWLARYFCSIPILGCYSLTWPGPTLQWELWPKRRIHQVSPPGLAPSPGSQMFWWVAKSYLARFALSPGLYMCQWVLQPGQSWLPPRPSSLTQVSSWSSLSKLPTPVLCANWQILQSHRGEATSPLQNLPSDPVLMHSNG